MHIIKHIIKQCHTATSLLVVLLFGVLLVDAHLLPDYQMGDDQQVVRAHKLEVRRLALKRCNECPARKCQVMGMQRYAEPSCEPLGDLGAPCRMWQEPENKTLHYPDAILKCTNVYMQFCPCKPGLVCHEAECRRGPQRDTIRLLNFDDESERDEEVANKLFELNDSTGGRYSVANWLAPERRVETMNNQPEPLNARLMLQGGSRRAQWPRTTTQ